MMIRITNRSLFIFALLFTMACICSCSRGKSKENPVVKSNSDTTPAVTGENPGTKSKIPAGTEVAGTLTPEALKEAHSIIPAYPNAELDTTKGNYSSTAVGKNYNIIYHTADSVDKVAEFFRKSIPEEYRSEEASSPGSAEQSVLIRFGATGFSQSGTVFIHATDPKTTEIIYYITQPMKTASDK
jgi:hypothetical protein